MILCSKLKNGLCKIVAKLQVFNKFNGTKSRLHCTTVPYPKFEWHPTFFHFSTIFYYSSKFCKLDTHVIWLFFSGDKKFKCEECHAKYSLKFNLNRHKRRVHNNDPKGDHTRCEICGLWFRVAATFRTHCYR